MYLNRWDFLKFYGLIIVFCAVLTMSYIAIQSGALSTSSGNSTHQGHSEFALKVAADGETVYTSAKGISQMLYEEIMEEVYPTPEAAVAATSPALAGNPAFAHAVNLCTHSDGKVSNQTGGGRHLTWFVKHENNRHYTKTAHQVLTINGYQTTELYAYDVSRSYCGCG